MNMTNTRLIERAEDVTTAIIERAIEIADGWYQDRPIDWEDLLFRLEEHLPDVDFGLEIDTPAIRRIKREVRGVRSER